MITRDNERLYGCRPPEQDGDGPTGSFQPLYSLSIEINYIIRTILRASAKIVNGINCFRQGFRRFQSTLVLAEHNNETLNPITANAVTAAKKLGGDVTVLVAGTKVGPVSEAAAKLDGVKKVLVAEGDAYKGLLAESLTPLILATQEQLKFTHIVAGATAFGKAVLPRIAAKLDVSPVSDIIGVQSADTFVRTIYAGNAIQTVKSKDPVKVITVRGTNFEPTGAAGSAAAIEKAPEGDFASKTTEFVSQELTKSDRPSLTAAKIIVSQGRRRHRVSYTSFTSHRGEPGCNP